jgi:serine kinase of HPr protein (carbohydrate metabolism regulator)
VSRFARNHHCCVINLADNGILIEGKSGSGKTSLMMGLLERARIENIPASFICDDQAMLTVNGEALIAEAPKMIAGKAELPGHGIIQMPHCGSTSIKQVFRLVPDEMVERMPKPGFSSHLGRPLPLTMLPERHENRSVRIVFAALQLI